MLNYIWAGLIILSLVFAVVSDTIDEVRGTFRNGQGIPVKVTLKAPYEAGSEAEIPVDVAVRGEDFRAVYGVEAKLPASYPGFVTPTGEGRGTIHFAKDLDLPSPWSQIRETLQSDYDKKGELRGSVAGFAPAAGAREAAGGVTLTLAPAHFHHSGMIFKAALYYATTAVTIAMGLIGVMALWLGLLKIAEKSGLIDIVVYLVRPVLGPLFPEIPRDHPALGMIAINLSAGMLGLGNAATPMGIKAMEELQKLNKRPDTATNPMVMLLALNTTCPQLVPGAGLLAVLGLQAASVWVPTVVATSMAMVVAIVATRLLARLPAYRDSDPDRVTAEAA
jgi:spore maturation protein A